MLAIGDGANDVAMIQVSADDSAQAACALPAQSYMARACGLGGQVLLAMLSCRSGSGMWLHDHADTELIQLAMHTMCARLDLGSSLTRPAIQKACATASKLAGTHSCQWAGSRGQPCRVQQSCLGSLYCSAPRVTRLEFRLQQAGFTARAEPSSGYRLQTSASGSWARRAGKPSTTLTTPLGSSGGSSGHLSGLCACWHSPVLHTLPALHRSKLFGCPCICAWLRKDHRCVRLP